MAAEDIIHCQLCTGSGQSGQVQGWVGESPAQELRDFGEKDIVHEQKDERVCVWHLPRILASGLGGEGAGRGCVLSLHQRGNLVKGGEGCWQPHNPPSPSMSMKHQNTSGRDRFTPRFTPFRGTDLHPSLQSTLLPKGPCVFVPHSTWASFGRRGTKSQKHSSAAAAKRHLYLPPEQNERKDILKGKMLKPCFLPSSSPSFHLNLFVL